jgi:hypothetical protein
MFHILPVNKISETYKMVDANPDSVDAVARAVNQA